MHRHKNEFAQVEWPTAYILLADGFDEEWFNQLIFQADLNGWKQCLVGLTSAPAQGDKKGYRPVTFTLSQLAEFTPQLLIIPEGEPCLMQLFVDPHVHTFIQNTVAAGGQVALSQIGELYLRRARIPLQINQPHFLFQRKHPIAEFAANVFAK